MTDMLDPLSPTGFDVTCDPAGMTPSQHRREIAAILGIGGNRGESGDTRGNRGTHTYFFLFGFRPGLMGLRSRPTRAPILVIN